MDFIDSRPAYFARLTNKQKRSLGHQIHQQILDKQAKCYHNGQRRINPDGCLVCKDCNMVLHDPRAIPFGQE